jgi:predicted nucleic-acid-binding protein
MRAIDTNVLVRLLTRDAPKQVAAADAFVQSGAWVSVLALAEATWVLTSVYECDAVQVARAVEMLLNHEHLSLQDAETVTAALETFRQRPKLGFSDCLLVELARKAGHLPCGTFDRHLGKVDGAEKL